MTHKLTEVNTEARTATCSTCGPTAIRVRTGDRGHECMTQRREQRARWARGRVRVVTPESRRAARLRKRYDLTPEQYDEMARAQGERCAICEQIAVLVVDHDHDTGMIRGLLCSVCNAGLGMFHDQTSSLARAIEYLEESR